ncbi:MAG: crossover junction endodeoxyribonuclease RuvC [Candidatus Peregrinibacteria bacterium Greene0416_19]|nr:MAG: crossover junction endodeoxyribonuclease RuvC [Candidatus Peregrinibacteria bacterium Greene0416_19]
MRIIGIDPGLATIGIGIIDVGTSMDDVQVVEWLTIETKAGMDLPLRLQELHADLTGLIGETGPEVAVVERLFFGTNERTALDVAHARGVILLALSQAGMPVLEPTPMQLKLAITGDGKADKRQMQDMVARMLQLAEMPSPDDAADGLALAVYGALHRSTLLAAG